MINYKPKISNKNKTSLIVLSLTKVLCAKHYMKTSPFGLFECIYLHVNLVLYKLNINIFIENTLVIKKDFLTQQNSLIKMGSRLST